MSTRASLIATGLALVLGLVLAALYAFALGTATGLELDYEAHLGGGLGDRPQRAGTSIVRSIGNLTLLLAGASICIYALLRGRTRAAGAAALLLVGANVTTQLMKFGLGHLDLLGGELARIGMGAKEVGAFPSGHATVAMSLALALVLVAPPATRSLCALAGSAYAAAMGVSLVALGTHYLSDVIGGFLVAAVFASLVLAWPYRVEASTRTKARRSVDLLVGTAVGILAGVAMTVAIQRRPELAFYGSVHTTFLAGAASIAVAALAIPATLVLALKLPPRPRRRKARPGPGCAP